LVASVLGQQHDLGSDAVAYCLESKASIGVHARLLRPLIAFQRENGPKGSEDSLAFQDGESFRRNLIAKNFGNEFDLLHFSPRLKRGRH